MRVILIAPPTSEAPRRTEIDATSVPLIGEMVVLQGYALFVERRHLDVDCGVATWHVGLTDHHPSGWAKP